MEMATGLDPKICQHPNASSETCQTHPAALLIKGLKFERDLLDIADELNGYRYYVSGPHLRKLAVVYTDGYCPHPEKTKRYRRPWDHEGDPWIMYNYNYLTGESPHTEKLVKWRRDVTRDKLKPRCWPRLTS